MHPLTCSCQSKKRLGVESPEPPLFPADDPIVRAEEQRWKKELRWGAMCEVRRARPSAWLCRRCQAGQGHVLT